MDEQKPKTIDEIKAEHAALLAQIDSLQGDQPEAYQSAISSLDNAIKRVSLQIPAQPERSGQGIAKVDSASPKSVLDVIPDRGDVEPESVKVDPESPKSVLDVIPDRGAAEPEGAKVALPLPVKLSHYEEAAMPVSSEIDYSDERAMRMFKHQVKERDKAQDRLERLRNRASDDTWTAEIVKGLDLSDARRAGVMDPEKDDMRAMDDFANTARTHQLRTTELLRTMQGILIEAITDIEALQAHFNRLR